MPSITASGQALQVGSPRYPNKFQLNVSEDVDVTKLRCAVSGRGLPEMWTDNRGNGIIDVSYRIGLVGEYKVHITYENEHIDGSPFVLRMR